MAARAGPLGRVRPVVAGASLFGAAVLAAGCPLEPRSTATGARDGAPLSADLGPLRLVDHLDVATVRVPHAADLDGDFGAATADDRLFQHSFQDSLQDPSDGDWFDRAFVTALQDGRTAPPVAAGTFVRSGDRGVARLARAGGVLSRVVAAPADEALCVVARLRPPADGGGSGSADRGAPLGWLLAASLETPACTPREGELLTAALAHAAQVLSGPFALKPVVLPASDPSSSSWRELAFRVPPSARRQSLLVTVAAGSGGLEVDTIELRRLTPAETLAGESSPLLVGPPHRLRRIVEQDLEQWDALALPAPGVIEWRVAVPRTRPRLELATAAFVGAAGRGLAVEVRVDDAVIARRLVAPASDKRRAPFAEWTVDLAPFAGKAVRVALAASGHAEDVAFLGAPMVLGTPAPSARTDAATARKNVLLISLDTLRADHLGCQGAVGAATPRIDRLAAEGTRFARVISPASWTLPTHVSMFSGQHPLVHQTFFSTKTVDLARTLLLPRRLRDEGWCTAAFTGGTLVHPRYGFGAGVDRYGTRDPGGIVGSHRQISGEPDRDAAPREDRMAQITGWLARHADQPFFLFVHTYLVHNYRALPDYLAAVAAGPQATREEVVELRARAEAGVGAAIERMHALYRATVAQADAEVVGRLLDALAALDLDDRTLVVLVADHGEQFFEHGAMGHGKELWHELTAVPWILRGPGVPAGLVRDDPVELADVAPTLAALLGLGPDPRVTGRDQLHTSPDENLAAGRLLAVRENYKVPPRDAIVVWPWKLLRRELAEGGATEQLFHLEEDPREARDRSADHPEIARALAGALRRKQQELDDLAATLPSSRGDRTMELTPEQRRMLEAQGYGDR